MVSAPVSETYWFLCAIGVFVVFSVFRFSLNVGFLERPLLIGLAWATISGDPRTALGIALFFELLWIDLFPAGTFIPPHLVASTSAGLALASALRLAAPQDVLLCLLLTVPLGPAGAKFEQLLRTWQNRHYNELVRLARQPGIAFAPERILVRSMVETSFCALVVFALALAFLFSLVGHALPLWRELLPAGRIGWVHIWLAASLGGVLAIRWKRAYGLLAAATALLAMSGAFGSGSF